MKKLPLLFLLVVAMIVSACASSFSQRRSKDITPQVLVSIRRVDTTDHIVYLGSDSTYHYFYHSQLFGGGSYKVEKKKMRFPDELPFSLDREPLILLGTFDEASGSWIPFKASK